MFFLVKYSKSLEEGSFRGRSADFMWMLLFGGLRHHSVDDLRPVRSMPDMIMTGCVQM